MQDRTLNLRIRFDVEEDGRAIALIKEIPGCMVYGDTQAEALRRVKVLALNALADQLEHGEVELDAVSFEHVRLSAEAAELLKMMKNGPTILLSDEEADRLEEMMLNPKPPTPALIELLRTNFEPPIPSKKED